MEIEPALRGEDMIEIVYGRNQHDLFRDKVFDKVWIGKIITKDKFYLAFITLKVMGARGSQT